MLPTALSYGAHFRHNQGLEINWWLVGEIFHSINFLAPFFILLLSYVWYTTNLQTQRNSPRPFLEINGNCTHELTIEFDVCSPFTSFLCGMSLAFSAIGHVNRQRSIANAYQSVLLEWEISIKMRGQPASLQYSSFSEERGSNAGSSQLNKNMSFLWDTILNTKTSRFLIFGSSNYSFSLKYFTRHWINLLRSSL